MIPKFKMAEFFLELFSEEIPAGLQKNLRENLLEEFKIFFSEKSIKSKKSFSLSTPNRLIVVFEGLDKQIKISSEEIKGPNTNAPEQALEGFMRSNRIEKKDLYKNKTEFTKRNLELKELNNGRLAMLAITYFAFNEYFTNNAIINNTPFFFKSFL